MTSVSGPAFFEALRNHGFDFFTGVPCSLLGGLYPTLESQEQVPYIESVREDEAVAQAAGAYMAGAQPVVLMQNSGLGNSLNVICSLNQIYKQPFLLVITWRGYQGKDAPEHLIIGEAMTGIFENIGLPFQVLDADALDEQLTQAKKDLATGSPTALIVKRGVITK